MNTLKTEINWNLAKTNTPPFLKPILIMMAGSGSVDFMQTWDTYPHIIYGVVTKESPNDDIEGSEYSELISGDEDYPYSEYQFYVKDIESWKYGSFEESQWYSDSIIAWAEMPKELYELVKK